MDKKEAMNYINESVSCLKCLQLPLADDDELRDEFDDIITKIYDLQSEILDNESYEEGSKITI